MKLEKNIHFILSNLIDYDLQIFFELKKGWNYDFPSWEAMVLVQINSNNEGSN